MKPLELLTTAIDSLEALRRHYEEVYDAWRGYPKDSSHHPSYTIDHCNTCLAAIRSVRLGIVKDLEKKQGNDE